MDESDQPPVIGQGRFETARTIGTVVFVLTGLLLIAWPFLAFVAIFTFDAPIRGLLDELFRYALAGAVWSYPAWWGAGLGLFRSALRRKKPGTALYVPMMLPLVPVLWVTGAFVLGN